MQYAVRGARLDIAEGRLQRAVALLDIALCGLRSPRFAGDAPTAQVLATTDLAQRRLAAAREEADGDADEERVREAVRLCIVILDEALAVVESCRGFETRQPLCLEAIVRARAVLHGAASECDGVRPPPLPVPYRDRLPPGAERRTSPRVPLETHVGFEGGDNFYTGFAQDISSGGLFICTYDLQPIGTEVELTFSLPDGYVVNAPGQVRWVRDPIDPDPDAPPGMGIMFEGLLPQDRSAIEAFVNLRAPLFYDDLI